jgi:MFS family permease
MASASPLSVQSSGAAVAACGLVALAIAMGIGRFAFTPLLPLMQAESGLSLQAGGWLASANYAGYLAGALAAARLAVQPVPAIVTGLLAIAATTIAMGVTDTLAVWLLLRTAAGVASAFVLVHVSAWSLHKLAAAGRPSLGGLVFSGVGVGIAGAGAICAVLAAWSGIGATHLWLVLGAVSAVALAAIAPQFRSHGPPVQAAPPADGDGASAAPGHWPLVICYGAFGFGYIIPATFLPVMARQALPDPAVFGWAWPLFGAAAAASTLLAAPLARAAGARTLWALSHAVMAAGCALAALVPSFGAVLAAALAVGGTFMVITMFGIQEARRVAGAQARRLIGAMTAAFALGQIAGPLLVRGPAGGSESFTIPLLAAAAVLVASTALLRQRPT